MTIKLKKKTILILFLILVIIMGLGIFSFLQMQSSESNETKTGRTYGADVTRSERVTVDTFAREIQKDDAILIDLRTPQEYASGRIKGATNIDYYAPDFRENIGKLDKKKSYKIYCNSGNRSQNTLALMRELGFEDVVELQGGIVAWHANNQDVCVNC